MMLLGPLVSACDEKDDGVVKAEEGPGAEEMAGPQPLKRAGKSVGNESLAEKEERGGHEEVLVRLFDSKKSFLGAMDQITDAASARDFVESLGKRKAGISRLLQEAQSLPPAGPAIRSRYQEMQGKMVEQSDLVRRQMEERLVEHPEAAEIAEIFGAFGEEREAEDLNGAFEELYQTQNLDRE